MATFRVLVERVQTDVCEVKAQSYSEAAQIARKAEKWDDCLRVLADWNDVRIVSITELPQTESGR